MKAGCKILHKGKVRDTYELPHRSDLLLVLATDRVSAYDKVLHSQIPGKGKVLTAVTVHFLTELFTPGDHHLEAYGSGIDKFLQKPARGVPELQKRALIVKRLSIYPIECIVRGYLAGSGWKTYKKTGKLAGSSNELPPGLHEGSRISVSFDPTTKAPAGEHDSPLKDTDVIKEYGDWTEEKSISIYQTIATFAKDRGFLLADTKFEFGFIPGQDQIPILADEVATPDSSRYWSQKEWEHACKEHKAPPSFDKQIVRDWAISVGKDEAPNIEIPEDVIQRTQEQYLRVAYALTGMPLPKYHHKKMGIIPIM